MSTSYYRFQIVLIADTMRLSDDKHKEGTEIESFSTPTLKYKTCVPLLDEVVTWIQARVKANAIYGQRKVKTRTSSFMYRDRSSII